MSRILATPSLAKRTVRTTGRMRTLIGSLALAITILASSASPADAATPGSWTGWTYNEYAKCWTAAQVPYLDGAGRVTAKVQVYCSFDTWLTVRGRVRSDRNLTDKTVATAACWATSTCPVLVPRAVYKFYTATCKASTTRVTHGYHSDILIYPGNKYLQDTTSTSGSSTLSPYCAE